MPTGIDHSDWHLHPSDESLSQSVLSRLGFLLPFNPTPETSIFEMSFIHVYLAYFFIQYLFIEHLLFFYGLQLSREREKMSKGITEKVVLSGF